MSLGEQILHSLDSSEEYRHAFLEETIRTGLAIQLKTIREGRDGMTQKEFADKLEKSQSWVSRLEDPNESIPTIPTLLKVARTLDIGLQVRYVPFAKVLRDVEGLSPQSLDVPEFHRDPELFPRKGPATETTHFVFVLDGLDEIPRLPGNQSGKPHLKRNNQPRSVIQLPDVPRKAMVGER